VVVLDASAVLELLLATPAAERVAGRTLDRGETLHAPHLLDVEIAQVLRRYWSSGELSAQRGSQVLNDLSDLAIHRYPHELFLGRIWELRGNLTAYDAAYIALAEALPAPFLTRDARLARARGHRAVIELL
jgi:predicted nucleic acid-binding protein